MFNWFRKRPIKYKIFYSYLILLVIPLTLIAVFNYVMSANIMERQAERQFTTAAQLASQNIDHYFVDIENLSINILQSPLVQEVLNQPYKSPKDWTSQDIKDELSMHTFLNGIYKLKPGISSIMIYGFNYRDFYYHPTRRWNDAYNGRKSEWFKQAIRLDGRRFITGKRQENQMFHTLQPKPNDVVTFTRMIKHLDSQKLLGVMVINIKLDVIKELVAANETQSYSKVIDQNGDLVVGNSPDVNTSDGKWMKVSATSSITNWESVFLISKDELLFESKQIRNIIYGIAFVLLVLALIVANRISFGIVKPIEELRRNMKDVEKGILKESEITANEDEIGELSEKFNHMVGRIKMLVDEVRDQEKKKMEIELSAMQARINPHFIYNTLNGIRLTSMLEKNQKITDLLTSFAHLLKFSSKNKKPFIAVKDEIALLEHYVKLMKLRNNNFDFHLSIDEKMKAHAIIPFILQPIVENSIFHGIGPLKENGNVTVDLFVKEGKNVAVIKDNGVGISQDLLPKLLTDNQEINHSSNFSRIGMKNVFDRLRLQFGEDSRMEIQSVEGQGTEVYIEWPVIPIHEAGDKRD